MARNKQVTRILRVISLLECTPAGFSVRELTQRLNNEGHPCELRTVYRDLEAIQDAYFPVTKEGSDDESRWKLDSIASISPSIQFSYRELMALFIARNSLDAFRGSPVFDAIQGFFSRIEKVLGPRAQEGLAEFDTYIGFKPKPTWQSAVAQEVLDTIHQACSEGHALEIEYRAVSGNNMGEVKTRKVGPAAIYFADSSAYLIAMDFETKQYKTYSLNRVRSAMRLDEAFDSHGFIAKEHLKGGIGVFSQGEIQNVELEVAEPIASYVSERRWHESQIVTREAHGINLKMQVKINDELARWVLGLGPAATVISPANLKLRIAELAREILKSNSDEAA